MVLYGSRMPVQRAAVVKSPDHISEGVNGGDRRGAAAFNKETARLRRPALSPNFWARRGAQIKKTWPGREDATQ